MKSRLGFYRVKKMEPTHKNWEVVHKILHIHRLLRNELIRPPSVGAESWLPPWTCHVLSGLPQSPPLSGTVNSGEAQCQVPFLIMPHLRFSLIVETYFLILTSLSNLGKQRQAQGISRFTEETEDNTLFFFNVLLTLLISVAHLHPAGIWDLALPWDRTQRFPNLGQRLLSGCE